MTTPPENEMNGRPQPSAVRADVLDLVDAGFRYALSLTHHRHDAEDLVQQACLRVVRSKGTMVEKGYLFVTIRNLYRDGCRRRSLASFTPLTDDSGDGTVSRMHEVDCRLDLESILATLSTDDREMLYLNCIEGFSANEISELTGQPRSTILSRLARTKKKLSDRFRVVEHEKREVS